MTNRTSPDQKPSKPDELQGEGNYDAARKFDHDQAEFAKNSDTVEEKAREAAEAVDGPEGPELRVAEAKARRKPKPSAK